MGVGAAEHRLRPLHVFGQPCRVVAQASSDAPVPRLVGGVDVGLVYHVHAGTVADIVKPPGLRSVGPKRVEALFFQGGYLASQRCGRRRVAACRAQFDGFPVAVDSPFGMGDGAEAHVYGNVFEDAVSLADEEGESVEGGFLGAPQLFSRSVYRGPQRDRVAVSGRERYAFRAVLFHPSFGREDIETE